VAEAAEVVNHTVDNSLFAAITAIVVVYDKDSH
jgi:hypothetical protein